MHCLQSAFGDKTISRRLRFPRSPDFKPCNFFSCAACERIICIAIMLTQKMIWNKIQNIVFRGRECCCRPGRQNQLGSKGWQNKSYTKNGGFIRSTIFKLLRQRTRNSIMNFFNFKNFLTCCYCDYSPRAPKNLSVPLRRNGLQAEENHFQLLLSIWWIRK